MSYLDWTPREMYDALLDAIEQGPFEQQQLVQRTDEAFAFIEAHDERMSAEDVLGLRVLLAQAETLIGRYFGM
ncbi:hypothetical protein D3C86_1736310 [compost metagenome]